MTSMHPHRRAGRTATTVLLAVTAVGTVAASAAAYYDNHTGAPATDTTQPASPIGAGESGTGTTVPQPSSGSGPMHAHSQGS
ncbi:hypothetical protein [Nocardia sp. alder85J]|uniref:hypothetical protein n=1 Tax=Nocardia sp. alder85J TaxID=2862949 RepID=UPI001CD19DD2|nr:hypothetical protein [Nocardia sp. alder85J]MCX4095804.1 hypothetical protein [Nocardia sp. alder85J]